MTLITSILTLYSLYRYSIPTPTHGDGVGTEYLYSDAKVNLPERRVLGKFYHSYPPDILTF